MSGRFLGVSVIIMNILAVRNNAARVAEEIIRRYNPNFVYSFQTGVGVKCRLGRFDSRRLDDFVEAECPFESTKLKFSDLLMPADLLRNRYTICGVSLMQSPHYRLMEDISSGNLTSESEYVRRCRLGAVDSRPAYNPILTSLVEKYERRLREFRSNQVFEVYVRSVIWRGDWVLVIADGKHRAALAAFLHRADLVRLRYLSKSFLEEPFFRQVHSHVMRLSPSEYSINQEMIRSSLVEQ